MNYTYNLNGVDVVHISKFASLVNHSMPVLRQYLTRKENGKQRPLKHIRDGCVVWIPVAEVEGYPFTKGSAVYHADPETHQMKLCVQCTFGVEPCEANQKAISVQTEMSPG